MNDFTADTTVESSFEHTLHNTLNQSQYDAVTYMGGPELVIAGAGSGKTRVLTYKIAWLLHQGCQPWNIMALTFTNKAAREMNERIGQLCAQMECRGMWSGTFHSLFARLLRQECQHLGIPSNFTIYDTSDSRSLIKNITKELDLDDKVYKPNRLAARISEAKNRLVLPDLYAADSSIQSRDHSEGIPQMHRIYSLYQQRLAAAGALDFDDLLLKTFLLLRDHEEVRNRYKQRFRYILVDEYQDTNLAQHRILTLLTDPDSPICVVGDDAQSIYSFRGADIANILHFQDHYPSCRTFKLECNYRSTSHIVEASNSVISHNRRQIPKHVYAAGTQGDPIEVFKANTDKEEATKVAMHIVKLCRKELDFNEIALLYRTNAQSRPFEEVFKTSGIPYRIYGGLSFYQRKEVKDVMAYLRLTVNPDDEEAFRRIVNYPARGIGNTTLQKLQLAAAAAGVSLWKTACQPEAYNLQLGSAARSRLAAFCQLIESFRKDATTLSAAQLAKDMVKRSGIARDLLADHTAEGEGRRENVDELLGSIDAFERELLAEREQSDRISLDEFLRSVSLLTDTDVKDDGRPCVTLMTIHAAKGLEFDAVFITGLEENLFPNANARLYPREMEEERRLFYVALTRARKHCFLSYALTRYRYGNFQLNDPSVFIDEIEPQHLDRKDLDSSRSTRHQAATEPRFSSDWLRRGRTTDSSDDAAPFNPSHEERPYPSRGDTCADPLAGRDDTPRRVVPPTPPAGFRRVSSAPAAASAATSQDVSQKLSRLSIGTRIAHERFGTGTVVGIEGRDDSAKVRVDFKQAGVKNLLVKFARFTIVE
ncbi:MAG: ATP-dependent helicase [Alloprevotella sp.]